MTILSHFSQVLRFEPANFQILPITTNEHSVTSQLYFFSAELKSQSIA